MRFLGLLAILGLPGLLLGIALGVLIRRWVVLAALTVGCTGSPPAAQSGPQASSPNGISAQVTIAHGITQNPVIGTARMFAATE